MVVVGAKQLHKPWMMICDLQSGLVLSGTSWRSLVKTSFFFSGRRRKKKDRSKFNQSHKTEKRDLFLNRSVTIFYGCYQVLYHYFAEILLIASKTTF